MSADPLNRQVGGDHYKTLPIQPVEFIEANGLGFCEGNVIKYLTRRKGPRLVDLRKAAHYLELLIAFEERRGDARAPIARESVPAPELKDDDKELEEKELEHWPDVAPAPTPQPPRSALPSSCDAPTLIRSRKAPTDLDAFARDCATMGAAEVAAKYEVSPQTIWNWRQKHGIRDRKGRLTNGAVASDEPADEPAPLRSRYVQGHIA
jgi:hypothetical protein